MPIGTDLGARLLERLAAGEPVWFPGLAAELAEAGWRGPDRLALDTYSTAGWLGGEPSWRRKVPGRPTMAVEALPLRFMDRFTPMVGGDGLVVSAVSRAVDALSAGGAASPVETLVRSVHGIRAVGPGYDCSHSEPSIPFSVFVSVPVGEPDAEVRLAESLLHEAMHLQLTLVERHAPIVGTAGGTGYSPWQRTERPVQGLIHGLYVFTAIATWLARLAASPDVPAGGAGYAARRLSEIGREVDEVAALATHPDLTTFGRALASRLLADPAALGSSVWRALGYAGGE